MLELRTLGGLELRRVSEGESPQPIALQTKRLVLLAYLAASPSNSLRRRDSLLGLFWPELDQEHARGALRQALHTLRSTLGEGVILTRGESEIGVAPSVIGVDSRRLESALKAGNHLEALSLYQGDFLEGVYVAESSPEMEDWIAAERARLRQLAAQAAWAGAEGSKDQAGSSASVRRAVQLSGDDEEALRRGIDLLDRRGDHAGATALYEEFAQRTARDLGVEPSEKTRATIDSIRARRAPKRAGPPADGDTGVAGTPPGVPGSGPITSPPESPAQDRRGSWRLVAAGSLALVVIVAILLGLRPPHPGESDMVAVAPFRVSGADSSHAWMQEGMVDLLTIRLGGDGGVKVADAEAVISSWHRSAPGGAVTDPVESPGRLAADVGAEWVVVGSVVGTANRVVLSARLEQVPNGRVTVRASAEGPIDSLPALVDRLATQLLGGGSGLEGDRLASLTSPSFPAVRAFLAGRSAVQRGNREEAVRHLREALVLDSTFALAGMELARAAEWAGTPEDVDLGRRRALAGRDRLGPSDRILLDAWTADHWDTEEMFRRWNAAVTAYPNRAETWYWLGDAYFHWGALAGIDDAFRRAGVAFRRSWQLDSAASGTPTLGGLLVAEPMEHMAQLAHLRGDTAEVGRLAAMAHAADSTSSLAGTLAWHRAMLAGPAARDSFWVRAGTRNQNLNTIGMFMMFTGEGLADYPRQFEANRRSLASHDPGYKDFLLTIYALNNGRPGDVPRQIMPPERTTPLALRLYLQQGRWWEGDTTQSEAAYRALTAGGAPPTSPADAPTRFQNVCTAGLWDATSGEYERARRAGERLRTARVPGLATRDSSAFARFALLCSSLLDAAVATGLRLPDAGTRLQVADSLARRLAFTVVESPSVPETNLLLARLWEAQGDLPRALAALRRRTGWFGNSGRFMSTFVREEGRLAALTGDTTGAIRAYRHYLGLRYDPEPGLRAEVERVRRELAILEGR
jgi:eukaryotic-like serine/threonine-protein kinase